jgi:nucleoside-diphosphate-sugar epimerase
MRVFVAGATGAIGRRLVPLLVARGFEVVGMTRSQRNRRALLEAGAEPVVADGLDRASVIQAVMRTEPEVVVHEMTDLAGATNLRRFDGEFATTNRLRTEGTDHLVEAARRARARRVVAQSFGNWNYERTGGPVKRESDPLDPDPPASMRQSLAAIRHLESVVAGESGRAADEVEGVVLRYGNLYGAGTGWSDPALVELVRARKLPRLARALGAKPPRHVPVWLGRLAAGEAVVSMFTQIRGASNEKAKHEFGWRLLYPSWREGFGHGLV